MLANYAFQRWDNKQIITSSINVPPGKKLRKENMECQGGARGHFAF